MLNHLTPERRLAALRLVREGRQYDLGRVLDEHVPVFPGRAFHQTLVTTAHHANAGARRRRRPRRGPRQLGDRGAVRHDAARHAPRRALAISRSATAATTASASPRSPRRWGVTRLGVETVPQIVAPGWLVDVAAVRGVERLRPAT